jgi:FMN-dependent NADH-azoreductase
MHNLTVRSVLKAWLYHVARARRTFDAQTRIAADVALQDHFSVISNC